MSILDIADVKMINIKTGKTLLDFNLASPPDLHMESSCDAIPYKPISFSRPVTLEIENCTISNEAKEKFLNLHNSNPNRFTLEYDSTWFVQARKHKKRRINKKWLKRYGYIEGAGRKQMKVKNFKANPNQHNDGLMEIEFEIDK